MVRRFKRVAPAVLARLSAIRRACAGQSQIAYDGDSGRVLLPGRNGAPALVVPLDYGEIIPMSRPRAPFEVLQEVFDNRLQDMTAFCCELRPHLDLGGIPELPADGSTPYWRNDYFTGDDARVAYAVVRTFRPAADLGNRQRSQHEVLSEGDSRWSAGHPAHLG